MKAENQRISEERDAAILSAEETRLLAKEQQVANDLLQSTITQLKRELSASDCKIDELKKEKGVQLSNASTWAATEIQLRNEVANLKANQTKNETLMKEAQDFREKLERLEKENEDLRTTRAAVLESATRSEKLAEAQVKALSAALQEAVKDTQDSSEATEKERQSMNSEGATEAPDRKKGNWFGKLLARRKTAKSNKQNEDDFAQLLERTGFQMVARAKHLQVHANNLKAEGKALHKKAKSLK
jgi:hypothetical protein